MQILSQTLTTIIVPTLNLTAILSLLLALSQTAKREKEKEAKFRLFVCHNSELTASIYIEHRFHLLNGLFWSTGLLEIIMTNFPACCSSIRKVCSALHWELQKPSASCGSQVKLGDIQRRRLFFIVSQKERTLMMIMRGKVVTISAHRVDSLNCSNCVTATQWTTTTTTVSVFLLLWNKEWKRTKLW